MLLLDSSGPSLSDLQESQGVIVAGSMCACTHTDTHTHTPIPCMETALS